MTLWLAAAAGIVLAAFALRQHLRARALESRLAATSAELQRVQQSCALLAPAGVVQRVVSEGLDEIAERKIVTVMFTDLVGYTAMSEQLEPPVMARILNGYFQRVSDAVMEHRGRIGTYLGDGILSYFGALEPNPWQCNDAVKAALALRDAITAYAGELAQERLPRVAVGIGIHRGPGLAGLIGSRERREYTVIGRTVNLAARVQALTRVHNVDILLTEAVREQLDPRFRLQAMPATPVKGIAEPVVTYSVGSLSAVA
jgi:class 3 adenylate cyclase